MGYILYFSKRCNWGLAKIFTCPRKVQVRGQKKRKKANFLYWEYFFESYLFMQEDICASLSRKCKLLSWPCFLWISCFWELVTTTLSAVIVTLQLHTPCVNFPKQWINIKTWDILNNEICFMIDVQRQLRIQDALAPHYDIMALSSSPVQYPVLWCDRYS